MYPGTIKWINRESKVLMHTEKEQLVGDGGNLLDHKDRALPSKVDSWFQCMYLCSSPGSQPEHPSSERRRGVPHHDNRQGSRNLCASLVDKQLCLPLGPCSQEADPYCVACVSPLCSFTPYPEARTICWPPVTPQERHIWSLSPVVDTELLNPLGPSESVFSPNEVTLSGLLNSFKIGAGHQKDQTMIRSLVVSALPPTVRRGKRGWRLS